MNSLEPTSYRHILWAPPRNLPFGLRSGCSVYHTQRWRDTGYTGYQGGALLSYHHGIDLFAKKTGDDRSVYAVTWGIVDEIRTSSGESSVLIRHEPFSSGYFTRYRHLRSVEVSNGNEVRAGQRIGYDDGSHVHLEWFQLPDPSETFYGTESGHTVYNVIDLDPTPILYHFDANRWSYEKGGEIERHQHDKYQNITWIRIVA